MVVTAFICLECGRDFTLPQRVREQYPNWKPQRCLACRDGKGGAAPTGDAGGGSAPGHGSRRGGGHTREDALARYSGGPTTGIFTDGSCQGNPGPGGWGAVYVRDDQVIEERHGFEPQTTNNRMELTAMIAGLEMAPADQPITVYSDSRLVVDTLNSWAKGWEERGWRRKDGPVQNLDLVQRAWELKKARPLARIEWVKSHAGWRWNEYADALATEHLRRGR